MTSNQKAIFFLLGISLLAGGCGYGSDAAGPGGEGPGQFAAIIPSVEVIQARLGSLPLEERLSGVVHAKNQVSLVAEMAGPVVRVAAQNGDYVRQGDPLVYLRDKQFQDQVRQSEAALQISQADAKRTEATRNELAQRLARVEQLADRQMESQQQLEMLRAQYAGAEAAHEQALARIAQAEANLEEQRELLRRTVIRAPISGYVGQRNVEVGMRVDQGTPLYVIGNFDDVRVEVAITDRMVNRITVGQTALIRLEDPNAEIITATVSRISPFLATGSFSAVAEIDVPNTERVLRPGMFVTVDILYAETEQAVLIPESALYEHPNTGILGVYVAPSLRTETPITEPDVYDEENPPPLTQPTPLVFEPIDVVARGRGVAGVSGIQFGDWVITVGQNLVRPVDGQTQARARPTSWDRIAALQDLQDRDLLRQFMATQQRMAKEAFPVDAPVNGTTKSEQGRPTPTRQ